MSNKEFLRGEQTKGAAALCMNKDGFCTSGCGV